MRQVIYFSTAADRQDAVVVGGILAGARYHNLKDGITGLLVAGGHRYLQVIEGPAPAIGDLVGRLRRDERHLGMGILIDRRVNERSFDRWSMAYAEEPQLGDFATFAEVAAQMRKQLPDDRLRQQLDCFVRTFASGSVSFDTPLWALAPERASVSRRLRP
ncbi:MAG: BLUF domain-containing protein [Sphingomicrobium sp.]